MKFKPSKIIAVGLNYRDHAEEMKMPIPKVPVLFMKPSTAVVEDGADIIYPPQVGELHFEAELAIVIGKKARNVKREDAYTYIKGFTCANDVTARDQQKMDGQWTRAKSYDTFCPLGPKVVKNIDPDNLDIKLYLNGEIKQSANTSNMIFKVDEIIEFVSGIMTLLPGDIIITGTPTGIGPMQKGDTVEVEIEGIGRLKNRVI